MFLIHYWGNWFCVYIYSENHNKGFLAVSATKEYVPAVPAGSILFVTIVDERTV